MREREREREGGRERENRREREIVNSRGRVTELSDSECACAWEKKSK